MSSWVAWKASNDGVRQLGNENSDKDCLTVGLVLVLIEIPRPPTLSRPEGKDRLVGIQERVSLYEELEAMRGRPLLVYVTSDRGNAAGHIAGDVVPEFHHQLQALLPDTDALDLLIVSNGGDGTVAWRIVSLIRERVKKFSVLIPQAAFSAATLIALGADEIVMHPNGNLGPTDPQITMPRKDQRDGSITPIRFGYEDMAAFIEFARDKVGLNDQAHMTEVFRQFCIEVGAVPIGVAARGSQLTFAMGERLLKLHMKAAEEQKARAISEALNTKFFHHGYPVSRNEAKEIGLKLGKTDAQVEKLMWAIWQDIAEELTLRTPFQPVAMLKADPACGALFSPVPQVALPGNLPPAILQQAYTQILQQVTVADVPPKDYENIHSIVESRRVATRYVVKGTIFATRTPDLQMKISVIPNSSCWEDHPIPVAVAPAPAAAAPAPVTKHAAKVIAATAKKALTKRKAAVADIRKKIGADAKKSVSKKRG